MFDLQQARKEWRHQGLTDAYIASKVLLIDPNALSMKLRGIRTEDISYTQATVLCEELGKPIDMFNKKGQ